jgi:hypothetical protein
VHLCLRRLHHATTTFQGQAPAASTVSLRDSRLERLLPPRPRCGSTGLDPLLRFRYHRTSLDACLCGRRLDPAGGALLSPPQAQPP